MALHHKMYLKKKDDHDKEKPKQHFFLFIPHISLNNIAIMFVFKSQVHLLVTNQFMDNLTMFNIFATIGTIELNEIFVVGTKEGMITRATIAKRISCRHCLKKKTTQIYEVRHCWRTGVGVGHLVARAGQRIRSTVFRIGAALYGPRRTDVLRLVVCQQLPVIKDCRHTDDRKVIDLEFPVRFLDGFVQVLEIQGFSQYHTHQIHNDLILGLDDFEQIG